MGMGITLKVMSGDTVSILGRSYWHSNGSSVDNNYSIPVNDLLLALTSPGTLITAKGYTYSLLEGLPVTPAALQGWLDNAPANGSNPKAYVNWILLDEQMKPVTGASGFDAVGVTDELKLHAQTVNIPKNGYLYVYVSNQSDQDVFFDNLQVVHARGPLLEETHYYPFGLTMAGISSKAAGKLENKKEKFQGQELDDELGLNWYGFKWRNHDPQIGRFIEIDPLSEKYVYNSTYAFSENKVTAHVELEGLESASVNDVRNPYIRAALKENVQKDMRSMRRNGSEAAQVKVSIGPGIGAKGGVGKIQVEGSLSGPQIEVGVNGAGLIDAKGSITGVNLSAELRGGKVKMGVNAGVVQYKDGNVTVEAATGGISGEMSASKTSKQGDASQTGSVNALDVTAVVGVNVGVVGGEASIDFGKAGAAVIDFFKGAINWMSNVVKDAAPKRPKINQIPK
jgi:RHS repeat-associated protein